MWGHHPRADEMLQRIQDGSLGELRRVTAAFGFDIKPYLQQKPPHAARNSQTGAATLESIVAHEYRFQRELGGGALLDTGWYCARVALWALGCLPRQVFATARYDHDVDINLSALMWYDNERMASFDCGYDLAVRKWFEVAGTKASLVCDDFLSPCDPDRPRFWLRGENGQSDEFISPPRLQEQCMIESFCRIVRSGELESAWPAIAIANQRMCDALGASARTGTVVVIE